MKGLNRGLLLYISLVVLSISVGLAAVTPPPGGAVCTGCTGCTYYICAAAQNFDYPPGCIAPGDTVYCCETLLNPAACPIDFCTTSCMSWANSASCPTPCGAPPPPPPPPSGPVCDASNCFNFACTGPGGASCQCYGACSDGNGNPGSCYNTGSVVSGSCPAPPTSCPDVGWGSSPGSYCGSACVSCGVTSDRYYDSSCNCVTTWTSPYDPSYCASLCSSPPPGPTPPPPGPTPPPPSCQSCGAGCCVAPEECLTDGTNYWCGINPWGPPPPDPGGGSAPPGCSAWAGVTYCVSGAEFVWNADCSSTMTNSCSCGCSPFSTCTSGSSSYLCGGSCQSCCTPVNPSQPTLVSPVAGGTVSTTMITLDWNAVTSWGSGCPSNNNRYMVYLEKGDSTPDVSVAQVSSSVTQYTFSGLTNGVWYWKVRADNDGGRRDSVTSSFTVALCSNSAPTAPSLSSPANGASLNSSSATLAWTPVSSWGTNCAGNTNEYKVILEAGDATPETVVGSLSSGSATFTTGALSPGVTYYWRINATNGAGSSVSTTYSFTGCQDTSPSVPSLLSPVNGASNQPQYFTLDWSDVSFGVNCAGNNNQYTVVLDQNNPPNTPIAVILPSQYAAGPFLSGQSYNWRLQATNGYATSVSSTRSFTACFQTSQCDACLSQGNDASCDCGSECSSGLCSASGVCVSCVSDSDCVFPPNACTEFVGSCIANNCVYDSRLTELPDGCSCGAGIMCLGGLCDPSGNCSGVGDPPGSSSCDAAEPLANCGGISCPSCVVGTVTSYDGNGLVGSRVDYEYGEAVTYALSNGNYFLDNVAVGLRTLRAIAGAPWAPTELKRDLRKGINTVDLIVGVGSSDCEADCTLIGGTTCVASCNGINDCEFGSPEAIMVCDKVQQGFIRAIDGSSEIVCCSGSPQQRVNIPSIATVNGTNAITVTRNVFYAGKLVKMKIVVFN